MLVILGLDRGDGFIGQFASPWRPDAARSGHTYGFIASSLLKMKSP